MKKAKIAVGIFGIILFIFGAIGVGYVSIWGYDIAASGGYDKMLQALKGTDADHAKLAKMYGGTKEEFRRIGEWYVRTSVPSADRLKTIGVISLVLMLVGGVLGYKTWDEMEP